MEEVARRGPRRAVLLIQTIFGKILSRYISRNSRSVWLKIGTLYQENITKEEVARRDTSSSGSPATDDFRKNFEWEYLDNQQIFLAENLSILSKEHDSEKSEILLFSNTGLFGNYSIYPFNCIKTKL